MRKDTVDQMIAFALEELLSCELARQRGLVRAMAQRWPGQPALAIAFAITNAAAMTSDNFDQAGPQSEMGNRAYQLAALVSADIFAIESMGTSPALARDLLHFWRRVDPYFLEI